MDDVIDRRGRRRDAGGQHVVAEQRVHEGRLAVVELAEHDQVESLLLELGDAAVANVVLQRFHADVASELGELAQAERMKAFFSL